MGFSPLTRTAPPIILFPTLLQRNLQALLPRKYSYWLKYEFDNSYVDDKRYSLGDVTLPPTGTFGDHFRRKVFSTTIMLRIKPSATLWLRSSNNQ